MSEGERQTRHVFIYRWNLNNKTSEQIEQSGNRLRE